LKMVWDNAKNEVIINQIIWSQFHPP
jgi:hypothetical protein